MAYFDFVRVRRILTAIDAAWTGYFNGYRKMMYKYGMEQEK
jgi:hypothetical protein